MNLFSDIMNIPCNNPQHETMTDREKLAYKMGHRDARHAAAELVIPYDVLVEQVERLLASHADLVNCARNPELGTPDLEWSEEIANDVEDRLPTPVTLYKENWHSEEKSNETK